MLTADNITVTSASGSIALASGANGYNGGGGGEARLEVTGTVSAPNISLTKIGGALVFNVGTLDITTNDTTLNLNRTIATDVTIDNLTFANGKTLAVTSTGGGSMTAGGVLSITGKDNIYNNNIASFSYNAVSITIDATGLGAGDTALSGTGVVKLNNALTLSNFDYSAFGLGEGATLIQNVAGTFTNQTDIDTTADLDKERTTFITSTNSLASYISKTTHNTAVAATADISVSPGSFGPVADVYQAGLDMNGHALTVASNANGTATFTVAGGLAASTINLTQDTNNLVFSVDALDVTTTNTTLNLNGTTSAGVTIGDLTFANGKTLAVNSTNSGTMSAGGALSIAGKDNIYNNDIVSFTYNATSVTIDAAGLGAGDTALGGTGVVQLTNALTLSNFDYSAFGLGEGATLIQNVAGTFTNQTDIDTTADLDKERTTFITSTNSLASYISKTTHNTAVAATADISVSPGSFGPVADVYQAGLDMNGHALTVASNANGTATFTVAGGLAASTINLTQNTNNLIFTADTLDVTATDTNFVLNNTTAPNVTVTTATLGNGHSLSIDNAGGAMNIATLNVTGSGNRLAVATSTQAITTLNATGAGITFVAPAGLSAGQAVVTTTNANLDNAVIDIDISGGVALTQGETFTLVSATNSLSAVGINTTIDKGRYLFNLNASGTDLTAKYSGLLTFEQVTVNAFAGSPWYNVNLVSGATHLDWLDSQPMDATLWAKISDSFDDNLALGGEQAAFGLQQMYGAYSAYGNTALSSDANRFRQRWQGQNRSFFDSRLFSDLLPGTASAGFASESGLASPVYGARDTIACGQSRIWAGGFGTWAKQDKKNGLSGYKYDSQGAALGYEYTIGNLNLGFAAAYSRGDLKVNDLRYKNDADVLNLALYGAYIHESGFYAEGGLGYGHAWNDYKVDSIATPGGVKKGKYGSDAFTADFELGYIARLPRDFNLIPSVGVEYTYLKNGSWTEGVNNAALVANRFDSGHDNGVDIPLGLRFNKLFRFGCDGGFVVPEVRAAYVYSADKSRPSITSGYAGAPGGATMVGVDPGRSRWRVGAGLSGRFNSRVDFRVDYDFETRSGFKGHNLNAAVGLSF